MVSHSPRCKAMWDSIDGNAWIKHATMTTYGLSMLHIQKLKAFKLARHFQHTDLDIARIIMWHKSKGEKEVKETGINS